METLTHRSLGCLCSGHLLVLGKDIGNRPKGSDTVWVNLLMALSVMELNVLELSSVVESRNIPVELADPAVNGREAGADITQIALEVLHVDRVEADDSSEQSDISLGDLIAEEVGLRGGLLLRKMSLNLVERAKERSDSLFVGFLSGCKAGLVHAVVDVIIDPFIGSIDISLQGLGEQVHLLELLWEDIIELGIEHADNFSALLLLALANNAVLGVSYFVADNQLGLLVEQNGDCESSGIVRIIREVDLANVGEVRVQRIGDSVLPGDLFIRSSEPPA